MDRRRVFVLLALTLIALPFAVAPVVAAAAVGAEVGKPGADCSLRVGPVYVFYCEGDNCSSRFYVDPNSLTVGWECTTAPTGHVG